jgi:hypothetical protein
MNKLSALRGSCSTARVLNLAATFEKFGGTPEYEAKPLFKSRRLNQSILLKHTLRQHERVLVKGRNTATKLIVPFAATDLGLGGYSVFVGEQGYESKLAPLLECNIDRVVLQNDFELLQSIDALPSFDPFLMREQLRRRGNDAARCYFDMSESDTARMKSFVESEICRLMEAAFQGDARVSTHASRFAELLMTDETAAKLDPLRATLRMSGEEYLEGVFAWKGFLYYNWLTADIAPRLPELFRKILGIRVLNATPSELKDLAHSKREIVGKMETAAGIVRGALRQYREAYERLAKGEPTAFRDFLLRAPALFIKVGEAIGIVRHIDSYWSFRFQGEQTMRSIVIEEALDIFGEFSAQLSGVADIRDKAA